MSDRQQQTDAKPYAGVPPYQMVPRPFDAWTVDLGPPANWDEGERGRCNRLKVFHDPGTSKWWSVWRAGLWQRLKFLFTNRLYVGTTSAGFAPMIVLVNRNPELDPANLAQITRVRSAAEAKAQGLLGWAGAGWYCKLRDGEGALVGDGPYDTPGEALRKFYGRQRAEGLAEALARRVAEVEAARAAKRPGKAKQTHRHGRTGGAKNGRRARK